MMAERADAYPVGEAAEAQAAKQRADALSAQASELERQVKKLMHEAEAARAAADAAQLEAEVKARTARVKASSMSEGELGDENNAMALCEKLSTSKEALRDMTKLRADRKALGVEGARGLAYLIASGAPGRLEVLTLSCNALGDLGIMTVSDALSPIVPLVQLDLASNSIQEAGSEAIARALGRGALPKLKQLNLKNNDVGDKVCSVHKASQCSRIAAVIGQPLVATAHCTRLLPVAAGPSHAYPACIAGTSAGRRRARHNLSRQT
jgi:multidrug efflux pump subunit AcrA (membrane-fusion protein)